MKMIHIRVEEEWREVLKERAKDIGISMTDLVRILIAEEVKKIKRER